MRIDAKATIAGVSVLNIRQFLREYRGRDWGVDSLGRGLKISTKKARELAAELEAQGYTESAPEHSHKPRWHTTVKGNALANATAAKAIKRATADKALVQFMERVEQVNQNPYFLYRVVKVVLFGSYLTDAETVNDVDIAIELEIKEPDLERRLELFQQHSHEAQEKGVYFANYTDYVCWPEVEVWKFLQARSRVISLHTTRDGFWETVPHRVIYTEEN